MKELGNGDLSSCPVCRVKVERTKGCNKMVCTYCGNEWCWECGTSIKGYAHFSGKNGCGAGVFGQARSKVRRNCAAFWGGIACAFAFLPFITLCPIYCFCQGVFATTNKQV